VRSYRKQSSAYTLLELLVGVAISSAIFGTILVSGVAIYRSCMSSDDYSYQANEQLRAIDYISRDLRSALSVTIPAGGQTVALTLPDIYTTYDAKGNPTSAPVNPVITSGAPGYGNAAQPLSVTYYVSGNSLLRQQTVPALGQTTTKIVASNVNDFTLNFVPLSTVVNFSITFSPRKHQVSNNLKPGTIVTTSVAARMLRIK
jgi:type II secretory pathway component PulJ